RLDQHRHAARPVPLVYDRLDRVGVRVGARALGDGALDVLLGHGRIPGLLDRIREGGVAGGVTTAVTRRPLYRPREIGELRGPPPSVASISIRNSSPCSAEASTIRPPSKRNRTPEPSRPPYTAGKVNATSPSTESSTGPVKNSPSGMLWSPKQGMKVRPATPRRMSVPGPAMWTSSLPCIHSANRFTSSDWRAQAVTGSGSLARQAE